MPPLEETLLAGAFDALDLGLIIVSHERRVAGWNAWMAAASGIPAERAMGRAVEELFPNASLRRFTAAVGDALELGASSLMTHSLHPRLLPLKTRAGLELVHDVTLRPLGAKPYSHCLVQITDVTVVSQREKVLRDLQNARYAAVVDNAPDAILTIDSEGLIQFANAAARKELAASPNDLIGKPVGVLFEDQKAWSKAWKGIIGGRAMGRPLETVVRRLDGEPSHMEVSAARWQSESRIFVSAILRNVNERHAAEAALRHLNETLEQRVATTLAERQVLADIVETTDALIQVVDADFKLWAVNKASADEFERVYGTRPKIGDNLLDLLAPHPQEQAAAKALWSRALAGEGFTIVQEFGDPARDRRFYELKFDRLRNTQGQQIAAFQIVYDVTERLERQAALAQTEEALRQSQKMEAIGQLTGGIAHDFNNLLTGIIGAMDILKRRVAARRYDDVERFMDAAATSANRAAALTHRLLAFARRQPLAPKPTDVGALIGSMDDFLRRSLGEQVLLTLNVAPDLWPTITDSNQLENAIINLAINGRDAMPDGGRLTIDAANVEVRRAIPLDQDQIEPGDYAVISITDTGTGMDADLVKKVFEPFFTTKPIGQGTGLGLSMIYGFAKQTRGHVRIVSKVGVGTQVSLYLPRYRGSLEAAAPDAAETPTGEGETVLLVEDDSSVRLLIGEVLRELGYACIEAVDGQTALPMLTSNARIDLMITDVGLPGMNGRQLADLARQHRPDLKILFVTGYAEHATGADRFLEPGMQMVTKPFALDALALKIRDMLAHRRA